MSDPWKAELDAIVGARHGGQTTGVLQHLRDLDTRHPRVPEVVFQIAWTLDVLDRPAEAAPRYEEAVALGLAPNDHAGALLGLGSCLRLVGQLDRAADVLESARRQFPENREFDIFLAFVRHDQGRTTEALQLALGVLVDTSDDLGVTAYQRAIRHHAARLGFAR